MNDAGRDCIRTDDELLEAVEHLIRVLSSQFAKAHYNVDVELAVWSAAGVLFTKPEEQRTARFLYVIAYRLISRELSKMRMVFPTDFQANPDLINTPEDDEPTFEALTFKSLDEQEALFLSWVLEDNLTQADISELTGMSKATVCRRWKAIIVKLKEENL